MMDFKEISAEFSNLKTQFTQNAEHEFFIKIKALVDELNREGVPVTLAYANKNQFYLSCGDKKLSFSVLPLSPVVFLSDFRVISAGRTITQAGRNEAIGYMRDWALQVNAQDQFLKKIKTAVDELKQLGAPITLELYQEWGCAIKLLEETFEINTNIGYSKDGYRDVKIYGREVEQAINNNGLKKTATPDEVIRLMQNWALKIYARREYFNDILSKPDDALTKQAITVTRGDEGKIKGVKISAR